MFRTECSWVVDIEPHRLALMARPRSGDWLEDEVAGWHRAGIDTVVSLLEPDEVRELGLLKERALCEANGIEFWSLPIPDRGVPSSASSVRALVDPLVACLKSGRSAAIHCRAGIGRTGMLAACVLLQLEFPFERIFAMLSCSRGVPVPDTAAQAQWVEKYARDLKKLA